MDPNPCLSYYITHLSILNMKNGLVGVKPRTSKTSQRCKRHQDRASKNLGKNPKIQRIFEKYPGCLLLYHNKTIPESIRIKHRVIRDPIHSSNGVKKNQVMFGWKVYHKKFKW